MPHDSPGTSCSFLMPKITVKFERDHLLQGRRKMHYNLKTLQDRRIVSIRGAHLRFTLGDNKAPSQDLTWGRGTKRRRRRV